MLTTVFHYKPYAPFGQLPIYREGDLILSQSGTISRHLANKFGIAGDTPAERARVDMYFELAKDISGKKAGMYDPDNHPDGARLKGFLAPAEAACDGTYFVGGKLTLADVAMFNSLQLISECAPDCLARYPKLQTFVANFSARPSVKAYLASERRVPITPNEDGRAPWHKDGYAFKTPLNPRRTRWSTRCPSRVDVKTETILNPSSATTQCAPARLVHAECVARAGRSDVRRSTSSQRGSSTHCTRGRRSCARGRVRM